MCHVHPGPSMVGYYRGIRAVALRERSMLTYNLVCDQQLTEDRTLANPHQLETWAADAVTELEDEHLLEQVLFAPEGFIEHRFDYPRHATPSDVFMRVVERHAHNARINRSAVELWKSKTKREIAYSPVTLDAMERQQVTEATAMCSRINCPITAADFTVVEDLGSEVLGLVRDHRILISRRCLDMGVRTLAGTLYEEWLHLKHRKQDCSRAMQNHLVDALFATVAKLMFAEQSAGLDVGRVPLREPVNVLEAADDGVPF